MGLSEFSRGENRITRRPLVPLLVGRGSRGRVMIFAAATEVETLKEAPGAVGVEVGKEK